MKGTLTTRSQRGVEHRGPRPWPSADDHNLPISGSATDASKSRRETDQRVFVTTRLPSHTSPAQAGEKREVGRHPGRRKGALPWPAHVKTVAEEADSRVSLIQVPSAAGLLAGELVHGRGGGDRRAPLLFGQGSNSGCLPSGIQWSAGQPIRVTWQKLWSSARWGNSVIATLRDDGPLALRIIGRRQPITQFDNGWQDYCENAFVHFELDDIKEDDWKSVELYLFPGDGW